MTASLFHRWLRIKLLALRLLDAFAFLPVFGMRLWIAKIFWDSGNAKLSDWEGTVALFADEYKVPVIPPEIAAYMGTAAELGAPVLLVLGLGARLGAAVLLVMTAVIEFTYMSFPIHQVWALMLALIFFQGPGKLSFDHFIRRYFSRR
ncbi:MAG: DoxX family protein [Alphaproteobacteria bacterium]|nr:DoxX family protein [Alphaproteobacteria bacterium]